MDKLVIIDGNAILYRAYHALPNFTTSKKEPVGAIFGFVSMLLRIIQDLKPTHLICTFDRAAPTFRQTMYVDYHANRKEMEDDLVAQIPSVEKVLTAFGIPIMAVDGYEADDVIGTLAFQAVSNQRPELRKKSTGNQPLASRNSLEVIIVTGDRDLLQLINPHVKVYMPIKGMSETKMYGEKEVEEKYGIRADQVVDYKALVGDASDNYPGVRGIGPKTASGLIQKYGTFENIYTHVGELPEKQKIALTDGVEEAEMAKKLAQIVKDAPVHLKWKECEFEIENPEEIIDVLRSFELRTLTNRFLELIGKKEEFSQEAASQSNSTLKVAPKPEKKKSSNDDQMSLL